MTDPLERVRPYAGVLQAMVEILGSTNTKFGEAMEAAALKCGMRVEDIPEDVQAALLTASFKIISGGRLPGAPDA